MAFEESIIDFYLFKKKLNYFLTICKDESSKARKRRKNRREQN